MANTVSPNRPSNASAPPRPKPSASVARPTEDQSRDTVRVSGQPSAQGDRPKSEPVDPKRQDQERDRLQAELDSRPEGQRDKLRPADGDDAERYNELRAEADSYEPGSYETEDGSLTVTEDDGLKKLEYRDGRGTRTVVVDSETGDVTESSFRRVFANGPAVFERSTTSYDRRGDTLGLVYEDRDASDLPVNVSGSYAGDPGVYSTSTPPRPQVPPTQGFQPPYFPQGISLPLPYGYGQPSFSYLV